jgi:hypothetical protein
MSERSRVRSANDEDLERDFPAGFVIGFPVRPPTDEKHEPQDDVTLALQRPTPPRDAVSLELTRFWG